MALASSDALRVACREFHLCVQVPPEIFDRREVVLSAMPVLTVDTFHTTFHGGTIFKFHSTLHTTPPCILLHVPTSTVTLVRRHDVYAAAMSIGAATMVSSRHVDMSGPWSHGVALGRRLANRTARSSTSHQEDTDRLTCSSERTQGQLLCWIP